MRASEIITIYLAAGAPFGAHHLLRHGGGAERAGAILRATGAALLWPLALCLKGLAQQRRRSVREAKQIEDATMLRTLEKIEQAKGGLLASLYRVQELAREASHVPAGEAFGEETRAICESIEKYVGLTMAASAADINGPPDRRELELCRIAGRAGEDLLLAGRCIHRRNAAQLIAHTERSRTELLHALATVRDFVGDSCAVEPAKAAAARRSLSVAVIKFYGQAINLLSLLEDESAATVAARLLDAECARLSRLESASLPGAPEDAAGGETCTRPTLSQVAARSLSHTQTVLRG